MIGLSGKCPLGRSVIRGEAYFERRQPLPRLWPRAAYKFIDRPSRQLAGLVARQRFYETKRAGRKAGSMRWRRAAMMVSLASPDDDESRQSRYRPSSSSGITKAQVPLRLRWN